MGPPSLLHNQLGFILAGGIGRAWRADVAETASQRYLFASPRPFYPFNPERLMPPMMYSCANMKRMMIGNETIVEPANTAGQLI